jgi:hypothetical protein
MSAGEGVAMFLSLLLIGALALTVAVQVTG